MYTPNFIEIGQTFLWMDGRTDVPTDGRTFLPLMFSVVTVSETDTET